MKFGAGSLLAPQDVKEISFSETNQNYFAGEAVPQAGWVFALVIYGPVRTCRFLQRARCGQVKRKIKNSLVILINRN